MAGIELIDIHKTYLVDNREIPIDFLNKGGLRKVLLNINFRTIAREIPSCIIGMIRSVQRVLPWLQRTFCRAAA